MVKQLAHVHTACEWEGQDLDIIWGLGEQEEASLPRGSVS